MIVSVLHLTRIAARYASKVGRRSGMIRATKDAGLTKIWVYDMSFELGTGLPGYVFDLRLLRTVADIRDNLNFYGWKLPIPLP